MMSKFAKKSVSSVNSATFLNKMIFFGQDNKKSTPVFCINQTYGLPEKSEHTNSTAIPIIP